MEDRLDPRSADIIAPRLEALLELFPEARSEGGRVDFERLQQALGKDVATGPERFGMSWPGKQEAIRAAQTQSIATLLPVPEESVDFDTTENLIIEGDNLEVLKLLQKSYLGKIKMIYIDPPYNTGNDFIYPDNYSESLQTYLEYTGQVDDEGRRFSTNTETDGRFHSKWMSMMYPRLLLARNLLTDDGVIFISIDDNELVHLRLLVEGIFGERNLLNTIAVKSSESSGVKMSHADKRLPKIKEYVMIAARDYQKLRLRPLEIPKSGPDLDKYLKYYNHVIENPNEPVEKWRISSVRNFLETTNPELSDEAVRQYKIENADRVVYRTNNQLLSQLQFPSRTAKVTSPTGIEYIWWEGKQMLFLKDHLTDTLCDLWTDISTINLSREMNGIGSFRNGQKPLALVERLLNLSGDDQALVLDFFAGSGTTAHAVLAQNARDGGRRRFILVQLPEAIVDDSDPAAAEFGTIADITRARVRKASEKVAEEGHGARSFVDNVDAPMLDVGFRSFRLAQSNFRVWNAAASVLDEKSLDEQLELQLEHVTPGRTAQDVVFEVLIKSKLPLTSKVEPQTIGDSEIWSVESGRLLVAVEEGIDLSGIRQIAKIQPKPETVVFLDRCFAGDDSLKANARKIFTDASIEFRTV